MYIISYYYINVFIINVLNFLFKKKIKLTTNVTKNIFTLNIIEYIFKIIQIIIKEFSNNVFIKVLCINL